MYQTLCTCRPLALSELSMAECSLPVCHCTNVQKCPHDAALCVACTLVVMNVNCVYFSLLCNCYWNALLQIFLPALLNILKTIKALIKLNRIILVLIIGLGNTIDSRLKKIRRNKQKSLNSTQEKTSGGQCVHTLELGWGQCLHTAKMTSTCC